MKINRKQILFSVLKIIEGISDKEYQKRIWIRGEGPEWDDFDETCCNFFQISESMFENPKGFSITETQYQLLNSFRDAFTVFSDENDLPQLFIDTPEWARIINLAKEVLEAFNYYKMKRSAIFRRKIGNHLNYLATLVSRQLTYLQHLFLGKNHKIS